MTRMLVSVRNVDEALVAARGGADFIDLKEPRAGALGGLPVAGIQAIVRALRGQGIGLPVSATIGDLPMDDLAAILAQVEAVGACGVDYVKVGIARGAQAFAVLDALAVCGRPVVPVFIADQGLDAALTAHGCALAFPGLMVDTADKLAGSLFDCVPVADLRAFLAQVQGAGRMAGIAGALRLAHVAQVRALAPDFAGFRSAVCVGDRGSELCAERLGALAGMLHGEAAQPVAVEA